MNMWRVSGVFIIVRGFESIQSSKIVKMRSRLSDLFPSSLLVLLSLAGAKVLNLPISLLRRLRGVVTRETK